MESIISLTNSINATDNNIGSINTIVSDNSSICINHNLIPY